MNNDFLLYPISIQYNDLVIARTVDDALLIAKDRKNDIQTWVSPEFFCGQAIQQLTHKYQAWENKFPWSHIGDNPDKKTCSYFTSEHYQNQLKIQEALNKLTPIEKKLLGLTHE